ncbi:hypothetical protein 7t3_0106 [Salmonella phage 7t3]|nr:hypothetical protein 7t3_0106 [Salmonella phage 7t3]
MTSTIHSTLTFIVSQIILVCLMLLGYNVYQSTGKFWHFLALGMVAVCTALLFIELMNRYIKVKQ